MILRKTRYLVYFQYVGTKYSGVVVVPPEQNVCGVLNYLEKAALRLRPLAPVKFVVSSRTDAGVHALCNTAHVDIETAGDEPPLSEKYLVQVLNKHLNPEPICVLGARRVPDTFHARFSSVSRTYIYRVATGCASYFHLPIFERNLCWPARESHFNLEAMREAASYLTGTHNFVTFCSTSSDLAFRNPVKHLARLDVRPTSGFLTDHASNSDLKFWELEFTSRSFLYKQVRRMTGILVAVGQGRMQPHHVKKLLEMEDLMAYPPNTIAPAAGLFLKDVEYDEADMDIGTPGVET